MIKRGRYLPLFFNLDTNQHIIMDKHFTPLKKTVIKLQAVYFMVTGIWPVLHIHSFMVVTGEKTDIWLVHMVGLLAVTIGISLFFDPKSLLLPICSAISFAAIDLIYVLKDVISPIYLVDFVLQSVFILVYIIPQKTEVSSREATKN